MSSVFFFTLNCDCQALMVSVRGASNRVMKDLKDLIEYPPYGITGFPVGDDIYHWTGIICGAKDTIWDGVELDVDIMFPQSYPTEPPKIKFLCEMFHPNVYKDGSVCLDVLNENWSSSYGVVALLQSIQVLLHQPNPNSPANAEAARLLQTKRAEYESRVSSVVSRISKKKGNNEDSNESC